MSSFAPAAITEGNPVPDDDADLEVLAAGLPRAVRLRALSYRRGAALQGRVEEVAIAFAVSSLAAAGLAGDGPVDIGPARLPEQVLAGASGLVLVYLEPITIAIGLGGLVLAVVVHLVGRRAGRGTQVATP